MDDAIETIVVPKDREISFIRKQVAMNIATLASKSRRLKSIPPSSEEITRRYRDVRVHLGWIEANLEMTPRIRDQTPIPMSLYEKWTHENWGSDQVLGEQDEESDTDDAVPGPPDQEIPTTEVALPGQDDPIFGTNGIMHGILLVFSSGGRKTYRVNPEVPRPSAQSFGHNDVAVGTWFPLQIVALQRGAHGSRMGGIHGSITNGAYSIVSSPKYDDLDNDHGDTLFYSGSNSHDNDDPLRPAASSDGTKALIVSMRSGKPVRVLRSGGSVRPKTKNKYAPSCGIRYDGLYSVREKLLPNNKKGGLYEQFRLVRLPDQPPLEVIRRSVPTTQQILALEGLQRRI
ncbi:PUA-like domain-containing protein [Xylariales sp. AK1849]|nr:PUA-like domain-containing protein [Xylariales sp. AK1849]